jgi:hypothetical protein
VAQGWALARAVHVVQFVMTLWSGAASPGDCVAASSSHKPLWNEGNWFWLPEVSRCLTLQFQQSWMEACASSL